MRVELAISLYFLFPLCKSLLWFALFSSLCPLFRYSLLKIVVKGNDRDILNCGNNKGATEKHRTGKKILINSYIIMIIKWLRLDYA